MSESVMDSASDQAGDSGVAFDSSDAARSAAPLPFAQSVTLPDPITLEHADTLSRVTIVYETYGTLNAAGDNAILICHALSGDSHVARHSDTDADGWWDIAVGPGKPIDTDRFFVICPNVLGGCRGTTGPNAIDPATGKRYAGDFPVITIADTVEVQKRLLDHLGIARLHAVIGGSMGGQQAMMWATRHPDRVANCVLIATATRLTSQALAFDIVARNAITRDPHFHAGDYYDKPHGPTVGLALARMLGHITYLSREAMTARFDPGRLKPRQVATAFENRFSVGGYLAYQGEKFVERFDANSYLTLSMMLDLFDFGSTPDEIERSFAPATCRFLVISFTSDWLFTPQQSRQMVEALVRLGKRVSSCDVPSDGGHDAFLLADGVAKFGELLSGFLSPVTPTTESCIDPTPRPARHAHRLDHQAIRDLLPVGASVLDLGCGEGELLDSLPPALAYRIGLELDVPALIAAVTHGQDVVHADLNDSLAFFRDQQFEVVVLSQALQCVRDTQRVLEEITRIGKRAIVSFPNFAHRDLRKMFFEQGRVPKAPGAFGYDWYDTPNRRFPAILDVQELCDSMGITIAEAIYLDRTTQTRVSVDPNLNATEAVFVLVRDRQ